MKKFILMTLVLGVYSMPISASEVDSDYTQSHAYTNGSECVLVDEQDRHTADVANAHELNMHSKEYSEDAAWEGATHKYDFEEFGYDEE